MIVYIIYICMDVSRERERERVNSGFVFKGNAVKFLHSL